MGCDLIGYILVAPKKFSKTKQTKVLRKLKKLHELASEVVDKYQRNRHLDFEVVLDAERMEPLKTVIENFWNIEGCDYDDLLQSVWLLTKDGEDTLRKVLAVFDNVDRSTMARPIPGNARKQILVTAIESWGDGFDTESPGWWLERADALEILEDLGVE